MYALLGPDYDGSSWTKAGERVHHLAVAGIRLIVEELRADVTRTRKDGSRGRLKIDYGDPEEPEAAIKWLCATSTRPRPRPSCMDERWS